MLQILEKYNNDKTLKNAKAVYAYARKHPFSVCLLPLELSNLVTEACKLAKGE